MRPTDQDARIRSIAQDIAHEINVAINYAVSETRAAAADPYNQTGEQEKRKDLRTAAMMRLQHLIIELTDESRKKAKMRYFKCTLCPFEFARTKKTACPICHMTEMVQEVSA